MVVVLVEEGSAGVGPVEDVVNVAARVRTW
jgi:hypothetical protein